MKRLWLCIGTAFSLPVLALSPQAQEFMEITKALLCRGEEPRLFFWRTSAGREVDLLVEVGTRLIPIEIKTTATPRPPMAAGVEQFLTDLPKAADAGYLIHTGDL